MIIVGILSSTIIRVDINKKSKEVVGCDFDPDAKIPDTEKDPF